MTQEIPVSLGGNARVYLIEDASSSLHETHGCIVTLPHQNMVRWAIAHLVRRTNCDSWSLRVTTNPRRGYDLWVRQTTWASAAFYAGVLLEAGRRRRRRRRRASPLTSR